jgi:hypothetical protein
MCQALYVLADRVPMESVATVASVWAFLHPIFN